jgi:hypothetical protein
MEFRSTVALLLCIARSSAARFEDNQPARSSPLAADDDVMRCDVMM